MNQPEIRVVIVEDSPTMRAILTARLERDGDIVVVGAARDAAEGRAMIRALDPDVVTLDIEMPGMNGLDFLEKIMALRPTPVIVVSGAAQHGAAATTRALALGAVACYAKSEGSGGLPFDDSGMLATMVRDAARAGAAPANRPRLIAIGASSGGVEALQILLAGFSRACPPTVIVQHIAARFAGAVARDLDHHCAPAIVLAEPDTVLRDGHIYLAPGDDRHLTVEAGGAAGSALSCRLRPGAPVAGHVPSVDVLFQSVARGVGSDAVGIVLTGMGSDGARGLLAMAQAGARTIVQDEASSTVFGMPRAAIALGAAGVVAPIRQIARHALARSAAADRARA